MKIVIDVSQMAYAGSGVARYTRELVSALLSLPSQHQFLLWAGSLRQKDYFYELTQHTPWNKAQWKIASLPPKLAGVALNTLNISFESLAGSYDLLHTSDWSEPASRAPKVTTVHDLVFLKYPETVDPLIRATQNRRLKRLKSNSTTIIADSESTKSDLIKLCGISKDRINVIYPGISPDYKLQSSREMQRVKTKYNLPAQFILSVGTQEPRKNLARLAEATSTLNLPLVLVGRHGWGDKTQTLGFVPDSDLPALYSASTVFAYPSLYEGFGFPVLEAMACGTVVVTSNVSSLPELAGNAAVLINPLSTQSLKSGIEQAIKSREKLIKLGLTQVKKFTWEQTAKQVMEVYEKTAHRN